MGRIVQFLKILWIFKVKIDGWLSPGDFTGKRRFSNLTGPKNSDRRSLAENSCNFLCQRLYILEILKLRGKCLATETGLAVPHRTNSR